MMRLSINWVKGLISVVAIGVIVVRIWLPDLKIDAITLGLIVVAILPWLSELIESAKFPGGWEIKFRDLRQAGDRVTTGASREASQAIEPPTPKFVTVAEHDPNLALVGLRIEIENRVRDYATKHRIDDKQPLGKLLRELTRRQVLPHGIVGGLQELIHAGNSAAHGAHVQDGVADWAIDVGPRILAVLDSRLA